MQQAAHLKFARSLFAHPQRAVEIALHEHHVVAHERQVLARIPERGQRRDDGRSDQPAVAPRNHDRQPGQQNECERQFEIRRKDAGRDQPNEEPPQCAAQRDRQVEVGQIARRRLAMRQFAIAEKHRHEHADRVQRHGQADVQDAPRGGQAGRHADDQHQRDEQPPVLLVPAAPAATFEGDDEGQQVQRQRQHPQKWHRRDVLCDVAGRRQQHHRTEHGEGEPQQNSRLPAAPGPRLRD